MSIVLNERDFAESAIQNCDIGRKPIETLYRIAKYYYAEGYKKSEIKPLIEAFMLKCDHDINIVKWQASLDKLVKDSDKFSLIEIDGVPITQREVELCASINGKQAQRLMFTLICLAKYSSMAYKTNGSWVNRKDKEIFKLANIVTSSRRQSLMLNDLKELGFIKFSRKVDNVNINVQCIDDNGKIAVVISDFRNIGYQYMRLRGDSFFECSCCGLTVKRSNNSQKYCAECAEEINRKKSREYWRNREIS